MTRHSLKGSSDGNNIKSNIYQQKILLWLKILDYYS